MRYNDVSYVLRLSPGPCLSAATADRLQATQGRQRPAVTPMTTVSSERSRCWLLLRGCPPCRRRAPAAASSHDSRLTSAACILIILSCVMWRRRALGKSWLVRTDT